MTSPAILHRTMRYFVASFTGPNALAAPAGLTLELALQQLRAQCDDDWRVLIEAMDASGGTKVFWHRSQTTDAGVTGDVHLIAPGEAILQYEMDDTKPTVGTILHPAPAGKEWSRGYVSFHASGDRLVLVTSTLLRHTLMLEYFNKKFTAAGILPAGCAFAIRPQVDAKVLEQLKGVRAVTLTYAPPTKEAPGDGVNDGTMPTPVPVGIGARLRAIAQDAIDNVLSDAAPHASLPTQRLTAEVTIRAVGRGNLDGTVILDHLAGTLVEDGVPEDSAYKVRAGKNTITPNGVQLKRSVRLVANADGLPQLEDVRSNAAGWLVELSSLAAI